MDGGASQVDLFDPKPGAPVSVRGDLRAIRTAVPGIYVSELLPRMARQMHRVTLIRTLWHSALAHADACHLMLTGRPPGQSVAPSLGALAARALGPRDRMPAYVALGGHRFAGGFGGAGALGEQYEPATTAMASRCASLRGALNTAQEPGRVREQYGEHPFGLDCLRARRLVEAGARFVVVSQPGWDTHCDNAAALRGWLAPALDQGMSALLADLHERGLLESTLVVWMGEFGRTPWINPLGGRDHWPRASSALLAGGGMPRGHVIGRTDAIGAEPIDDPVTPRQLADTILAHLAISPAARYTINSGAPPASRANARIA